MKQLKLWPCGLVVNASFATFGSCEFDFLVCPTLFALFRQLFTPGDYTPE